MHLIYLVMLIAMSISTETVVIGDHKANKTYQKKLNFVEKYFFHTYSTISLPNNLSMKCIHPILAKVPGGTDPATKMIP